MCKPFVKWAGGKSQILNDLRKRYPKELGHTINSYCEPFVGGGAILFDILKNYNLDEIIINDINQDLINCYQIIKHNVDKLIERLIDLQNMFWSFSIEEKKHFYYEKRELFNKIIKNRNDENSLERGALFIFLNKTCFNGLYRVNKKGEFNVPIGSYKRPVICDDANLKQISFYLKNVKIFCGNYVLCKDFINDNTFVYLDPPYRPLNITSSFTAYTDTGFSDNEQYELAEFVKEISLKGAKILLSNSDPLNTSNEDLFFDSIYKRFKIQRIKAKRMINCNGDKRGEISELMISNF